MDIETMTDGDITAAGNFKLSDLRHFTQQDRALVMTVANGLTEDLASGLRDHPSQRGEQHPAELGGDGAVLLVVIDVHALHRSLVHPGEDSNTLNCEIPTPRGSVAFGWLGEPSEEIDEFEDEEF